MSGPRTATTGPVRAYGQLVDAYDAIHRDKDYALEARTVRKLARRSARRPLRTLLDVACGSGRHLQAFSRWFACTGVDESRQMLARARRRVPRATFVRARMQSFRLDRQFDVVTCLFSSIGYVSSEGDLRRTLRNFARHTAPGGVVVIEPWLSPERVRLGQVYRLAVSDGDLTVVRMDVCRMRTGRSVFDFHYLLGRPGRIRHVEEVHDLGLFSRSTMESAFRAAGLDVRYYSRGLSTRRGLYVGGRPPESAPATVRPTRGRGRPRGAR